MAPQHNVTNIIASSVGVGRWLCTTISQSVHTRLHRVTSDSQAQI